MASAAELREAICKDETITVKECVSVVDLAVRNDVGLADEDPDRYLNASVGHVAFPWTEPSLPVTVPVSGEVQNGWHLLPPHKTLGNLAELELPLALERLEGDIETPDGLIWRLEDESVILFEPQSQQVFGLNGLGATVWKMCAGYRNRSMVKKQLPLKDATKIEKLIDQCLANRLLVQI